MVISSPLRRRVAVHHEVLVVAPRGIPGRVYRVAVRRLDFLLDPFADDRLTLAGRKPRAFAHARQRSTRNGLTAVLLSSTYFEHRSTLLHWMHF